MSKKLNSGQVNVLRLMAKNPGEDGWSKVSDKLYPFLEKDTPKELAEFERRDGQGYARLTEEGENVLNATRWL